MDIRILRDGIEIGPFPEETVHTLLQQGNVAITDLSWRPGLDQWVPLANVLYGAKDTSEVPPARPAPPPPPANTTQPISLPKTARTPRETRQPLEPATPKQKAFLTYMGIAFGVDIDREAASRRVNEAMEDPKNAERLARWNKDRLKLHPALYAAEIQAAKEHRAQQYFEICEAEGAPYFSKVTKAHCQVLVGYLDVHHPNWDANESEAAASYFFPAIAEKFPQLVNKEARGTFKYPEGPKVARELASRPPVARRAKARQTSPVAALARGIFFGALILGVLWFVKGVMEKSRAEKTPGAASLEGSAPAAANSPVATAPASAPASSEAPEIAQTAPAEQPADHGEMTPSAPAGAEPTFEAANAPSASLTPAAPAVPSGPRTMLKITKAVDVQLQFGKMKLSPGTSVKFVQQNGALLTVQLAGKDLVVIPASSTDIAANGAGEPTPGAFGTPLGNPTPALNGGNPPTPRPSTSESLFGPPTTSR